MSEIRLDKFTGRLIVFAEYRSKRPNFYVKSEKKIKNDLCPFCEGNEHLTPPEIFVLSKNSADNISKWSVRVVPNKFPALNNNKSGKVVSSDLFTAFPGEGIHEVIIETPDHKESICSLSAVEIKDVITVYINRIISLKKMDKLKYVIIFKNSGPDSGATIAHTHSQVLGIPMVPKLINDEIEITREYRLKTGNCLMCDMLSSEIASDIRIVTKNEKFAAFCPYASRFPYEVRITPLDHFSHFEDMNKNDIDLLSKIIKEVFHSLEKILNQFSYNYTIHTAPLREKGLPYYHWFIEIMPRLAGFGGFEIGTESYINSVYPEIARNKLVENI